MTIPIVFHSITYRDYNGLWFKHTRRRVTFGFVKQIDFFPFRRFPPLAGLNRVCKNRFNVGRLITAGVHAFVGRQQDRRSRLTFPREEKSVPSIHVGSRAIDQNVFVSCARRHKGRGGIRVSTLVCRRPRLVRPFGPGRLKFRVPAATRLVVSRGGVSGRRPLGLEARKFRRRTTRREDRTGSNRPSVSGGPSFTRPEPIVSPAPAKSDRTAPA